MDKIEQPPVFLTGGTGFIGSHFLQLAGVGRVPIRALRRNSTSSTKFPVSTPPEWIEGALDALTAEHFEGCRTLVHLASPGVSPQQATCQELIYWNVLAFEKMINTAAAAGVKRFIVAGTFAEYGRGADGHEFIPGDCNLMPTTPYAASKAAAWMIAQSFAVEKQIEFCWLRIFSAYGEGQHPANFWPALRAAALAGEDFRMSPGEQIRDYIEVEKVASLFLKAATSLDLRAGAPVQYNIGSGTPVSMRSFAERFWKEWNAQGRLHVGALPYRDNEVMRFVPDAGSLLR